MSQVQQHQTSTGYLRSVRLPDMPYERGEAKSGLSEWLHFIHRVNTLAQDRNGETLFGEPVSITEWSAGGTCELYDEGRVIKRLDGIVNVQAFSERTAKLFDEVCVEMGIPVEPTRM